MYPDPLNIFPHQQLEEQYIISRSRQTLKSKLSSTSRWIQATRGKVVWIMMLGRSFGLKTWSYRTSCHAIQASVWSQTLHQGSPSRLMPYYRVIHFAKLSWSSSLPQQVARWCCQVSSQSFSLYLHWLAFTTVQCQCVKMLIYRPHDCKRICNISVECRRL